MDRTRFTLVFIRYDESLDKCVRWLDRIGVKWLLVNNGKPQHAIEDPRIINGSNKLREFSAITEGLERLPASLEYYLFANDTLLRNFTRWKLEQVIRTACRNRFTTAAIFGFVDKTFEVKANTWFANPGYHIRSDCFAVNSAGATLLREVLSRPEPRSQDLFRDLRYLDVVQNYLRVYHPTKLDQGKDLATYLEVLMSHEFFMSGLVVPCMSGRVAKLTRLFLETASDLLRRGHTIATRTPQP